MLSRWKLSLAVLALLGAIVPALQSSTLSLAARPEHSSLLSLPAAQGACPQNADKLVLAFYFPWYFGEASFVQRQNELSDQPQSPYFSSDPAVIDRHMSQAKSACIDALIVAWTGPGSDTDQPRVRGHEPGDVSDLPRARCPAAFEAKQFEFQFSDRRGRIREGQADASRAASHSADKSRWGGACGSCVL